MIAQMMSVFRTQSPGCLGGYNHGSVNTEFRRADGMSRSRPQNGRERRRPCLQLSPSPGVPVSPTVEAFSTNSTSDVLSRPLPWLSWASVVSANRSSWPSSPPTGRIAVGQPDTWLVWARVEEGFAMTQDVGTASDISCRQCCGWRWNYSPTDTSYHDGSQRVYVGINGAPFGG
jgi:hypothetical protein